MCDLCLDKNFQAINPIKELFPLEICQTIIMSEKYHKLIRSAFCLLSINCWLEGEDYQ